MKDALKKLTAYNGLINEVELLRIKVYSHKNSDHTCMLIEIWNGLVPNEPIENVSITKRWGDLGFQGTDPATDFRGMGMLGLSCLK